MTGAAEPGQEDLVVVLETPDATALPVVTSLLESADIPFVVRGADHAGFDSMIRQAAGLFMKPRGIRVLVPREHRELAEQLLDFEPEPEDPGPEG